MVRLMLAVMLCGALAVGCNPTPAAPKAENTKAKAAASVGAAGAIIKFPIATPVTMLLSQAVVTATNFTANKEVAQVSVVVEPAPVVASAPAAACQNGACNVNGQCTTAGCVSGACVAGCGAASSHGYAQQSHGGPMRRMLAHRPMRRAFGRMFGRCRGGC